MASQIKDSVISFNTFNYSYRLLLSKCCKKNIKYIDMENDGNMLLSKRKGAITDGRKT